MITSAYATRMRGWLGLVSVVLLLVVRASWAGPPDCSWCVIMFETEETLEPGGSFIAVQTVEKGKFFAHLADDAPATLEVTGVIEKLACGPHPGSGIMCTFRAAKPGNVEQRLKAGPEKVQAGLSFGKDTRE